MEFYAYALALQRDSKAVLARTSGDKIALVSYLPTYCFVPSVRGKPLVAAKLAIAKANCATGKILKNYFAAVPAGRVIKQTPRAGVQRPEDARVALVVSRGRSR